MFKIMYIKHFPGGGYFGDCCKNCLEGVRESWIYFWDCSGDYIDYNNPYSDLSFTWSENNV